jgi:glycosyltransferase involved in cell wall biosynthesis
MLSVCIVVKNRSRVPYNGTYLELFPNCLKALDKSLVGIPSEIVVADFQSDDWPLEAWVHDFIKASIKVITVEGPFSLGKGRNICAKVAAGDLLFFCDADFLVTKRLIKEATRLPKGYSSFPRLNGYELSRGACIVHKCDFAKTGGYLEFESWGGEDMEMFYKLKKITKVIRPYYRYFIHQWHPTELRSKYYKNKNDEDWRKYKAKAGIRWRKWPSKL